MIEKLIEFSAREKFVVLLITAAVVAFGVYSLYHQPVDAIPDLSDTQVIVYSKWDRSPDIIEDQVTYPVTTALLGAPKVKAIRGYSDFGFSYVYIIFEDGTDIYWARSRVLEYLSKVTPSLPAGVKTEIGPDATGVGWVFQYALVDTSHTHTLADLRSFQDWNLRYALQSVPGVAEIATVGGFQSQYQVVVDRDQLAAYNIPIAAVAEAVRNANVEIGARLIEFSGTEYMVRGHGYIKRPEDIEQIVLKTNGRGTPVLLQDVARVERGPEIRRGVADLDGMGDAVAGIVVMRQGENADRVIHSVKEKLGELEPSFPKGVKAVTTYDRSDLIERSIKNLKEELVLEIMIVSLVILIFLWHIPSAIIPIVTIPVSVLLAFIPMRLIGLNSNIMSLAGIAISIGVLVDGAIVEVENAYKKLELWIEGGRQGDFHAVRLQALKEVGPSVFFSLLVIAVAFLPVFTLVDQEGRLFRPLAFTKNFVMAIAAILAVTLDPAMRMLFARMEFFKFRPRWLAWLTSQAAVGKYYKEERHPISRLFFKIYEPPARLVLEYPKTTIMVAVFMVASTLPVYLRLGSEFMPPLNEGTILYMPTTLPGISIAQAQAILQVQDEIIRTFPEVERVFGKAGRAETATDPAPLSMFETTIMLKPASEWRFKRQWYSDRAPDWLKNLVLRRIVPERISWDDLINEMDQKLRIPGVTNAWTMPIRARIDMLTTGVRTPVGIKVFGPDLQEIEKIGSRLEELLKDVPGTRSVFAERVAGGYFVDFDLRRDQLARYGLSVADAQEVVASAIGGENVTTTIEGRARYSVNIRYPRELRDNIERLREVLVSAPSGAQIPISQIAEIRRATGPSMLRDENGMLVGYVFVDLAASDIGGYVERAKDLVRRELQLPAGYSLSWSGQYENMLRVRERLKIVIPITLVLIFALLYMNTKSAVKASIVMLAVPFSLIGAVWLMFFLGYNMSIAAWVGMIALMGLDAETGVFMLLFLDLSYEQARHSGRLRNGGELIDAIIHGAVKRVRPKAMTVTAAFMGLMPMMWSIGAGADMMKRVAAPMVGGLATSFLLELLVYPSIYYLWKHPEVKRAAH
ncbi:MAG: CusA/CzcA family heavy metal efflux RND transporter [Acidobacteriota bacterium]|jgi:Cu(I)/Ag(I) efflux system membrane protein CusA/SilA